MTPPFRSHRFHQPSHPDFPATEPDDRVNGMAVRAVHVAEVNPEKSEPSAVMPGDKKAEALDLQGLPSGGDSWTRTNDPIDVNDVLYRLSHATLLAYL